MDVGRVKSKRPGPGQGKPRDLDPEEELLRRARAGEIRLGRPNSEAVYTRPPKDQLLPHEEVMALLDWVRGDR